MPTEISKDFPETPTKEESSQSDPEDSDEGSPNKTKAKSGEKVGEKSDSTVEGTEGSSKEAEEGTEGSSKEAEEGTEGSSKEAEEGTAGTSKETEVQVETSEDNSELVPEIDESASAEIIKQVGGGYLDSTRDSRRITPGSGGAKGPHPGAKGQPGKLPQRATDKSRPTSDVESSQAEVNSRDALYRRMFFMRHFQYDDIIIHVNDNFILIDAKHGDHVDEHGLVSRTFVRLHKLPEHVIAHKLTSYFTGDGVLVIEAPCLPVESSLPTT